MRRVMRWTSRAVVALLLIVCVLWLTAYGSEWLLRRRAERLLADVQALQVKTGKWTDLHQFMARWGRWGDYEGTCNAADCEYRVTIADAPPSASEIQDGSKLRTGLTSLFDSLGLRFEGVWAVVALHNNQIVTKDFFVDIDSPRHGVRAGWFEAPTLFWLHERASHPNRSYSNGNHPGYEFSAQFTPDEQTEMQARLMQIDFHCLTSPRLCEDAGRMMPLLQADYLSEYPSLEAEREACILPFWVRARDEPGVLEGEVLHASKIPGDDIPADRTNWKLTLHVTAMLKGSLKVPLDKPLELSVEAIPPDSLGNFPYKRLLAAGSPNFDEYYRDAFESQRCDVVEASIANVREAKRGVAKDFRPPRIEKPQRPGVTE